ncbi:MAG: hypothetical protein JNM07_07895 [Phycisphaerae bacterium]|nr:hypothetical protein [Phycisphaerae bacterium]
MRLLALAAIGLLLGSLAACSRSGSPGAASGGGADGSALTPGRTVTLIGTLRGGMAGIGGEHTGWQLERDSGGPIMVDMSAINADLHPKMDGAEVSITGPIEMKKWVERGEALVLVAKSVTVR